MSISLTEIKVKINEMADNLTDEIILLGERFGDTPELGFKEFKTAAIVKEVFQSLQMDFEDGLAITGVKGRLKGRNNATKLAIIGELDAVINPNHIDANKETGAVHACGHHAQLAAMAGAAMILKKSGVMDYLDGEAVFFATPAEECVELAFRSKLKKDGKIRFFGGKQELINIGAFDDIDMAMMFHASPNTPERSIFLHGTSLGFVNKTFQIIGKESHAGAAPWDGVNALNAACAAIMCVNSQRETFKDTDKVRFHCIMIKGGDVVNIVPNLVDIEACVRAANSSALSDALHKVDRAIIGAVDAFGAKVEIIDTPGYLPLLQDKNFSEIFCKNSVGIVKEDDVHRDVDMFGSTDIGDLSQIIPCIQPVMGGFCGALHDREFRVSDKEFAFSATARIMALTLAQLLFDNAKDAKEIKAKYVSLLTKEEYIKTLIEFEKKVTN